MLQDLVSELRPTHVAIATALVRDDGTELYIDPGQDAVDEMSLFEIGSVTKTMTGTLLAVMVGRGVVSLDTTVGDVLDERGRASAVTLKQLATHTAGMPRLAPNHQDVQTDPLDPYCDFTSDALAGALALVELLRQGSRSTRPSASNSSATSSP